jgi:hypothetical protein
MYISVFILLHHIYTKLLFIPFFNFFFKFIALKDMEIDQLRSEIECLERQLSTLSISNESLIQAVEMIKSEKNEIARLLDEYSETTDHSNTRQKIKIQMQVKKELEASNSVIEQLTRERDIALAELSSIKKTSQTEMMFPDKQHGHVNISMRKRKAMGDTNR